MKILRISTLNEKSYRILISLFFPPSKKTSGSQQEKPSQSPRMNKTYYFEPFLQRNLGEKGFLFYFSRNILKKMNGKAYLILTSLFFRQNFEWDNVAHNFGLIFHSSFCYTGFTESYVSLSVGDWEELHWRLDPSKFEREKEYLY